ncbi:PDR/VanB family oxidoreductase [Alcaligenaceae bacterium CGII-47]|nr:PDR/VanB family oxidoreductase [Alcaligenaceae bacterium CGII-47]
MNTSELSLDLIVQSKQQIANGIFEFDLRHPDGHPLPAFSAGAHLSVKTPIGLVNKYSLSNNPLQHDRYVIAVKREERGRGGSLSMADELMQGSILPVSLPNNVFELVPDRPEYIFIAGGIGITPIYSMIQSLYHQNIERFKLYYLTRDAPSTAYMEALAQSPFRDQVIIHHDEGDPERSFDLWPVLEKPAHRQIYCCGPRHLMEAVKDMTGHWSRDAVTFESFGTDAALSRTNVPFEVRLQRSDKIIQVSEQSTLLEALRESGVQVSSSCESGTCGSCRTGLISGDVEHRDMVLEDHELQDNIMVCVSRARGGTLVLDL